MKIEKKWLKTAILLLMGCLPTMAYGEEDGLEPDRVFTQGEVVVTEEKVVAIATTTVTEVSMEEITAKGAKTVAEALEFLPGVLVQSVGKGRSPCQCPGG